MGQGRHTLRSVSDPVYPLSTQNHSVTSPICRTLSLVQLNSQHKAKIQTTTENTHTNHFHYNLLSLLNLPSCPLTGLGAHLLHARQPKTEQAAMGCDAQLSGMQIRRKDV